MKTRHTNNFNKEWSQKQNQIAKDYRHLSLISAILAFSIVLFIILSVVLN